jgi:APA family basic amino acid/polyamine antiporter
MFFDSISLVSAAAAIFVLRYRAAKEGELPDLFRMRGYPYLPALFIVIYMAVNASVMISNPTAAGIGCLLFFAGLPLYWVVKRNVK